MPELNAAHLKLAHPSNEREHIQMLYDALHRITCHEESINAMSIPENLTIMMARFFTEAVLRGVGYDLAGDIAVEQLKEAMDKMGILSFATEEEMTAAKKEVEKKHDS